MPASTRFHPLDGIRFFAFIPVFYLHACGGDFFYHLTLTSLYFFFLLSGFLTGFGRLKDFLVLDYNRLNQNGLCNTPPIFREREGHFRLEKYSRSYMWNKILTFYPWHAVCLVWSVCIFCQAPSQAGYMPQGGEEWVWKTLAYLLLIQSWWVEPEIKFCFNGVSWFLASLMFCYAVSPLLLKMVARGLCRRGRTFLLLMLAGALVLKSLPYLFELDGSLSDDFTALYDHNIHSWPPMRLLDYMVGMMVGIWYALRPKPQGKSSLTAFARLVIQGILLAGIVGVSLYCPGPLALLLCGIWIYCLVLWHDGIVSRILGAPLLVFLGGLVMPVYLTHNLVLKSLRALKIAHAGLVQTSIVFIFCFLFAWCLMQLCRWVRKRYTS